MRWMGWRVGSVLQFFYIEGSGERFGNQGSRVFAPNRRGKEPTRRRSFGFGNPGVDTFGEDGDDGFGTEYAAHSTEFSMLDGGT